MRVLKVAEDPHRCDLDPDPGLPEGSLVQCEGCGRRYVYAPIPWERIYRRAWPWERT